MLLYHKLLSFIQLHRRVFKRHNKTKYYFYCPNTLNMLGDFLVLTTACVRFWAMAPSGAFN